MKKVLLLIMLFTYASAFTQTTKSTTIQPKNKIVYIPKTDAVFIAIKARVFNDLKIAKQNADPKTPDNKLRVKKLELLSEEKRTNYYALFEESMRDYCEQVSLDFETFMMVFSGFIETEQKKMEAESDFRVRKKGENKYVAEFWDDAMAANSEANAIEWAKTLSKRYPDDKTILATVKATYAKARKLIKDGKQPRYSKILALLYTKEKDGSIVFNDPGQALIDII